MAEAASSQQFVMGGISHQTASLSVREMWALNTDEKKEALALLKEKAEGALQIVILGTCNRTEFYFYPAAEVPFDAINEVIGAIKKKDDPAGSNVLFSCAGDAAVRHLFQVAGGLDSQILGETEIQGQVKNDHQLARELGGCGSELGRLFEHALKAGKRIRRETALSEGVLSAGQAAVTLAEKVLGDLKKARVLLVGTGKIGSLTAQALVAKGVKRLDVASRTPAHARELAETINAETVPFDSVVRTAAECDLVISSTGAPEPLFKRTELAPLLRARSQRPLVVVDLAVPRDFEPGVTQLDNVFLHDLDDLEAVIEQSRNMRSRELPRCEMIIDEEVNKFTAQFLFRLEIEPLVRRLIDAGDAWWTHEVERSSEELSEENRRKVEEITGRLVRKFLLLPVNRLKRLRNRGDLSAEAITVIKELFKVGDHDYPSNRNESK